MREAPLPGRPAAAVPRGTALPLAMCRHPRAHGCGAGRRQAAGSACPARRMRAAAPSARPRAPGLLSRTARQREAREARPAAAGGPGPLARSPSPARSRPRAESPSRLAARIPNLRRLARLRPHAAPLRRLKGCRLRRVPSSHRRPHVGAASGAGPLPEMASGGGLPTIVAAAIGNY